MELVEYSSDNSASIDRHVFMAQSEGEANDPRPNERPEDIEEDKLSANTG